MSEPYNPFTPFNGFHANHPLGRRSLPRRAMTLEQAETCTCVVFNGAIREVVQYEHSPRARMCPATYVESGGKPRHLVVMPNGGVWIDTDRLTFVSAAPAPR